VSTHNDVFADNDFCFACGGKNPLGLHLSFTLEGDDFCCRIKPKPHWQGFYGVVHGGIQSTIIDDMMSNHLFRVKRIWAATGDLSVRFRKPVPIERELLFVSRIVNQRGRIWEMSAQCMVSGEDNAPALTTAKGRFIEVPGAKV